MQFDAARLVTILRDDAVFRRCSFVQASWLGHVTNVCGGRRTKFIECDFSRCLFKRVEFWATRFENCVFEGAKFDWCELAHNKYEGASPSQGQVVDIDAKHITEWLTGNE